MHTHDVLVSESRVFRGVLDEHKRKHCWKLGKAKEAPLQTFILHRQRIFVDVGDVGSSQTVDVSPPTKATWPINTRRVT